MPREVVIPQQAYVEEFMLVEEFPGSRVRVVVGVLREDGKSFDVERYRPQEFIIQGEDLEELNGPPTEWAPDKPEGTYRNQDIWHFVDKMRSANA